MACSADVYIVEEETIIIFTLLVTFYCASLITMAVTTAPAGTVIAGPGVSNFSGALLELKLYTCHDFTKSAALIIFRY